MFSYKSNIAHKLSAIVFNACLFGSFVMPVKAAQTPLADQPTAATSGVPANVMLDLSVEWPTGVVQAYNDEAINGCTGRNGGDSLCYLAARVYVGYFDPFKCYTYNTGANYFEVAGYTAGASAAAPEAGGKTCTGQWSGNYLNWATMQTVDMFRWAMTGGDRFLDTTAITVLEKARHDGQGGFNQFPIKRLGGSAVTGNTLTNGVSSSTTVTPVAPSSVTPFSTPTLYTRTQGLNTVLWVNRNRNPLANTDHPAGNNNALNTLATPASWEEDGQCNAFVGAAANCSNINGNRRRILAAASPYSAYYVRVKVCSTAFPETSSTCTIYGSGGSATSKPTGLIQENATRMRFGAFGYLLDGNISRDGGVLRARMKDVGPEKAVPASLPIPNTRAEWSLTTGIYIGNPDPADAANTSSLSGVSEVIAQSGVTQYLNKFGRRAGYKNLDPVSELYAESIKYLSHLDPTTSYFASLDNTRVDGFPVITNWASYNGSADKPMQYACQKNFVIGISDTNTHRDKNLSGGISGAQDEGALPADIDTRYNVRTLVNDVAALEGAAGLYTGGGGGALADYRNCCNGSYFIAGLAYWANTNDINADFPGTQKVRSYFVDVRENGSWGTSGSPKNQLWLAAKYGGFDDKNSNGTIDSTEQWSDPSRGTVQGYAVPKNYFAANQPEFLVAGLRRAFNDINSINASGAGVGVSSSSLTQTAGDTGVYQVTFSSENWSGKVVGLKIDTVDSATGDITLTPKWDAQALLNAQGQGSGWDAGRRIVTSKQTNGKNYGDANPVTGIPFRIASLTAAQKLTLGATAAEQQDVLAYLRGSCAKEGGARDAVCAAVTVANQVYRQRAHLLGDIVDSEAVYVGKPEAGYTEDPNSGYLAFATANATRTKAVYVGSNDGMLHAFNAELSGSGGSELFAFVPSFLFQGVDGVPANTGLKSRTNENFVHKYMVNATPAVRDIKINLSENTASAWRTLLVGGMGKGGRGFYALDVTDPSSFTSESNVASKVRWEFTDPDMGYSYGKPVIVKSGDWYGGKWVVMLTSGFNNIQGSDATKRGKGFLYVLDAWTGKLIKKILISESDLAAAPGSETDPVGFTHINGYTPSYGGFITDQVYGGDLKGNVWRVEFRNTALADVGGVLKIATLTDALGVAQPITTPPQVEYVSAQDLRRYVFIGTGRFLEVSDTFDSQTQTFYALRDGSRREPFRATQGAAGAPQYILNSTTVPSITHPLTRSQLGQLNEADVGGLQTAELKPGGWRYDLPQTFTSTGAPPRIARSRVIINPYANEGVINFVSSVPVTNDPCQPGGKSFVYALSYTTGKSRFVTAGTNTPVGYIETLRPSVKTQFVLANGQVRILSSDDQGKPGLVGTALSSLGSPQMVNWREIDRQQ